MAPKGEFSVRTIFQDLRVAACICRERFPPLQANTPLASPEGFAAASPICATGEVWVYSCNRVLEIRKITRFGINAALKEGNPRWNGGRNQTKPTK